MFLNDGVKEWLQKYLATRKDDKPALFVTFGTGERLQRYDLCKQFRRYAAKAGIKKKVTPHIIRHSMATLMLANGADIIYIKELQGHADIETTVSYYLGTDKHKLKEVHSKFLRLE